MIRQVTFGFLISMMSSCMKVVLGSFNSENLLHQKHQLNANKYLFVTFFVNHCVKLYVIMQKYKIVRARL